MTDPLDANPSNPPNHFINEPSNVEHPELLGQPDIAADIKVNSGSTADTSANPAPKPSFADIVLHSLEADATLATSLTHWCISGASVRGLSHQQRNLPCQDRHGYRHVSHYPNWSIAVVADGAGSKRYSDIGAELIVTATLDFLNDWLSSQLIMAHQADLPAMEQADFNITAASGLKAASEPNVQSESQAASPNRNVALAQVTAQIIAACQSQSLARRLYEHLYLQLRQYADQHSIPIDTLGSTLIATMQSPQGVILIHIGDGRAAYQDSNGQWHALMKPWKSEDGYTLFVTTASLQQALLADAAEDNRGATSHLEGHTDIDVDLDIDIDTDSNNNTGAKLASMVQLTTIQSPIQALVLMSDGCEGSAFECQVFDELKQQYVQPNRPFAKFLDPVKSTLLQLHQHHGQDYAAIDWRLADFLQQGTVSLKQEGDDKSLVFAIYEPSPADLNQTIISAPQ
ncbi:MAG: protein phosphatase 2C domain-containing protein [Psychrobacter sp.]|nr:protein phosphatase 2C domain-containing protein [Psychrobacter sp.]